MIVRALEEATNEYERELIHNIKVSGYQVTAVGGDESSAPFAYSIGIFHSYRRPDLLVVGLGVKACSELVSLYGRRIRAGDGQFETGYYYSDFLTGFDVFMLEANEHAKRELTLSCKWFYRGIEFPLLQCVWPSIKGFWPWDQDAWTDYKKQQPLYGIPPTLRN